MPPAPPATGLGLPLRLATLPRRGPHPVALRPDARARAELAAELDLLDLKDLDFAGELVPEGRAGWRLTARLTARIVQACGITGAPVPARIDEGVTRRYVPDLAEPTGPESEMPEDDEAEPLRPVIDAGEVLREALALALPPFPRAPGAALPEGGTDPGPADRPNPFAALAGLKRPVPPTDTDA